MWSICSILTERRRETASFSSSLVQILKAVEIKGSKKHLFFNYEGIFPQYQHCFSPVFAVGISFFNLSTLGVSSTLTLLFRLFGVRRELTVFRRAFVNF